MAVSERSTRDAFDRPFLNLPKQTRTLVVVDGDVGSQRGCHDLPVAFPTGFTQSAWRSRT